VQCNTGVVCTVGHTLSIQASASVLWWLVWDLCNTPLPPSTHCVCGTNLVLKKLLPCHVWSMARMLLCHHSM
jgi:hypothetical protein